jgi:hypothetical protein
MGYYPMGDWAPDIQITRREFLRVTLTAYIFASVFVSYLHYSLGNALIDFVPAVLVMGGILLILYRAFLMDLKEESRYKRRAFDLSFEELVAHTEYMLRKEGLPYRKELYLAEGVIAKGAGHLKRWNYSGNPMYIEFTVHDDELRLRVYSPNRGKEKTCCIVLGPFDGELLPLVNRLRRQLDGILDVYGME